MPLRPRSGRGLRLPAFRPAPLSGLGGPSVLCFLSFLCVFSTLGCSGPRPAGARLAEDRYGAAGQGHALRDADAAEWAAAPAANAAYPAPAPRSMKSLSYAPGGASAPRTAYGGKPLAAWPDPLRGQGGTAAPRRLIHYSGQATLRSAEPEKVLDSAIAAVKAGGGYLESRASGFAALRVPAADFDTLFARILSLAEVVEFSQEAEDITEAFQDAEQRLRVATATLERLEALVQKAKTEAQKLRLLRELKRLREEREVLEARRKELAQNARFASIRLTVRQHAPMAGGPGAGADIRDFLWIHALDPFRDARFRPLGTTFFRTPAGMVRSKFWYPRRSTSSQGSEFWGSEVEVEAVGDSRFWAEAVRTRLKDGYKAATTRQVGAFRFCSFQSFGPAPFFYWVGVRARGETLDLAEIYFPDAAEQAKLLPAILAEVERKSR